MAKRNAPKIQKIVKRNAHLKHRIDVVYENGSAGRLMQSRANLENWHVKTIASGDELDLVRVIDTPLGRVDITAADILNWAEEIRSAIQPVR